MTATEFKAWFEGFCESIPFQPSLAQWERVKERARELGEGSERIQFYTGAPRVSKMRWGGADDPLEDPDVKPIHDPLGR